jgi:6-phosphofructokinase 1
MAVQRTLADSPDPIRLGGIGYVLQAALEAEIKSEVRTTILGHVQRGGTPTAYDRNLATSFGAIATDLVAAGEFGRMVAVQNGQFTSVPLDEVADRVRKVPHDAPLIRAALGVGTSFGVPELSVRLDGARGGTAVI